ncbi:Glycosyltransferase involved in cell wall bisynthesis [Flexibacter flexilis DSM 6793]|uniref:Glycosyltransferase involved in cell wall bisynthesis n=1 Tax=Flexibacter flexilis DSM 6793 TaxID=927664 RepID=A0A1I1FP77_9BACT|nr:glycosyltransferase [Flexibacter flexilis]SFB99428.1 Glycosyltransferase involved in cell wall bisynthesis [Flexibacter flexilis DSM 6793]
MFSICIPNYNYEKYLGRTIQSVLSQTEQDFEIVIADNKSTDSSVAIVEDFIKQGKNLRYVINSCNVGFAGNLDRAGALAKEPYCIMLSSDDLMRSNALAEYKKFIQLIGNKPVAFSSRIGIIDPDDKPTTSTTHGGRNANLWKESDIDQSLTAAMGYKIYKISADEMLKRCILYSANPLDFLATCFSREAYEGVGGYGSSRIINPDKWFHLKLLAEVEYVYLLDVKLFDYRIHPNNQTAQQASSGHLKYMVDEYRTSMEIDARMLQKSGLTTTQVQEAFVKNTIFKHGIGELSKGFWLKSLRILFMGLATYPSKVAFNKYFIVYVLLLLLGPVGIAITNLVRGQYKK